MVHLRRRRTIAQRAAFMRGRWRTSAAWCEHHRAPNCTSSEVRNCHALSRIVSRFTPETRRRHHIAHVSKRGRTWYGASVNATQRRCDCVCHFVVPVGPAPQHPQRLRCPLGESRGHVNYGEMRNTPGVYLGYHVCDARFA